MVVDAFSFTVCAIYNSCTSGATNIRHCPHTSLSLVYAYFTTLSELLSGSVEEIVESSRTFLLLPANRVKLSSSEFLQILKLALRCPIRAAFLFEERLEVSRVYEDGMTPFARARFSSPFASSRGETSRCRATTRERYRGKGGETEVCAQSFRLKLSLFR